MGMFIAVEGPNGVGKTTIAKQLADRWAQRSGMLVHLTSEPSSTSLGRWLREAETSMTGRSLALALAADRYTHVDDEIIPILDSGSHVVTDRYVQSSLVLQRVDAVDLDEIWSYNRYVLPPALSVYLDDDPVTITARLRARPRLSRLEATGTPERELSLYREAYRFLDRHRWRQQIVDCRGRTPDEIVETVLTHIREVPR